MCGLGASGLTRFNLFLRDRFVCQYCGDPERAHLRPRHPARAGRPHHLGECRDRLRALQSAQGRTHSGAGPHEPQPPPDPPDQLAAPGTWPSFPPNFLHETWRDYLYWDIELEA
jgi:hypothetical protein